MEPTQAIMEESKHSGKSQQPRKRKKQYYNRIRHQMEFYFGDANLSKDRFLNKLLAVNPCKIQHTKFFWCSFLPNQYRLIYIELQMFRWMCL